MNKIFLLITVLICHYGAYASKGSAVDFFSFGFGKMIVQHSFAYAGHGHELETQPYYRGFYLDLDFRWKRFGFRTTSQVVDRDYFEVYPETPHPYKMLGMQYSTNVSSHLMSLLYKGVEQKHFRLILLSGPVIVSVNEHRQPKFNYDPHWYEVPRDQTRRMITWSAGLDIQLNLLRQYIWMSAQGKYIARAENSAVGRQLCVSVGLSFNVSKLLQKISNP